MKKQIFILVFMATLLVGCWQPHIDKQQVNSKLSNNTKLVDVHKQVDSIKEKLEKAWFTWEKLKKELKRQKEYFNTINSLSWEARKSYIFQKEILPKLVQNSNISPNFCKTENTDLYFKCINQKNVPLQKILDELPEKMKDFAKKKYFYQKYLNNRSKLLEKTNNKIAIQQKEKVLDYLFKVWVLKNKNNCSQLPEKETKEYCENLFK